MDSMCPKSPIKISLRKPAAVRLRRWAVAAAWLWLAWVAAPPALAQPEVVIGVIYPLTGPVGAIGRDAVAAIETAVDLINGEYDLDLPLARRKGLTGLDGTPVRIVVMDHRGRQQLGREAAETLILRDKVHALFGAYYSSITDQVSRVAERFGIPLVNGASGAPNLTQRGLRWFFRTGPHERQFTPLMFQFVREFQLRAGIRLRSVALLYEDTPWGMNSGWSQQQQVRMGDFRLVRNLIFRAKTTSMAEEVEMLKQAAPDVLFASAGTNGALLFLRTAKELEYTPGLLITQNAGFSNPAFIKTLGLDSEGVITRARFNPDLIARIPLLGKVNALFRLRSGGRDLSDVPVRAFTGFLALADAINRAESTDPEEIRAALKRTNMPPGQLVVPWLGIRFGEDGHNALAQGILTQVQKGRYCTIYPYQVATCPVVYPMTNWDEKALMEQ